METLPASEAKVLRGAMIASILSIASCPTACAPVHGRVEESRSEDDQLRWYLGVRQDARASCGAFVGPEFISVSDLRRAPNCTASLVRRRPAMSLADVLLHMPSGVDLQAVWRVAVVSDISPTSPEDEEGGSVRSFEGGEILATGPSKIDVSRARTITFIYKPQDLPQRRQRLVYVCGGAADGIHDASGSPSLSLSPIVRDAAVVLVASQVPGKHSCSLEFAQRRRSFEEPREESDAVFTVVVHDATREESTFLACGEVETSARLPRGEAPWMAPFTARDLPTSQVGGRLALWKAGVEWKMGWAMCSRSVELADLIAFLPHHALCPGGYEVAEADLGHSCEQWCR